MKLSDKRTTEIYTAINDPIMDLRLKTEFGKVIVTEAMLFDLEQIIWRGVAKALNFDPA